MENKRTSTIERLDRKRLAGVSADSFLANFEGILKRRQEAYYSELVQKTRETGEIHAATVYKMVALDDLLVELDRDVALGKRAARKLDEMADNPQPGGGAEHVEHF